MQKLVAVFFLFDLFSRKSCHFCLFAGYEADFKPPKDSEWEKQVKPKAEFVDCKCQWGLFRDRNVTMRKPSMFMTGLEELADKGQMVEYDGSSSLGWWKSGSQCDAVKGNDGSTLPPGLNKDSQIDIWIALMCRTLRMTFEKVLLTTFLFSLSFCIFTGS